jgi:hypothetical protein
MSPIEDYHDGVGVDSKKQYPHFTISVGETAISEAVIEPLTKSWRLSRDKQLHIRGDSTDIE